MLAERASAETIAEGWRMAGDWTTFGTVAAAGLLPALAVAGAAWLAVCGSMAYVFTKRKAACDAIIDDPPRDDFHIASRPQRTWFDPQRLQGTLTPAEIHLAELLSQGDALLRAAVRADERAQGAYRRRRQNDVARQSELSDEFFDGFINLQPATATAVDEVTIEIESRRIPDEPRATIQDGGSGLLRPEGQWMPPPEVQSQSADRAEAEAILRQAGMPQSAIPYAIGPARSPALGEEVRALKEDLRSYGRGVRQRSTVLASARPLRPTAERRFDLEAGDEPQN